MAMHITKRSLCACAWVASLGLATHAHAHLMPENHGTVNVVGKRVYMVVSLPVEHVEAHLEQGRLEDGSLTATRVKDEQEKLRATISQHIQLSSGLSFAEFDTIMLNLPTGYDHDPEKSTELIVMAAASFEQEPQPLTITSSLWSDGAKPLSFKATISAGRTTLREEVGTLTPEHPTYTFFATPHRPDLITLAPLLPGAFHATFFVRTLSPLLLVLTTRP